MSIKCTFSFRGLLVYSFDPETKDIVTDTVDGIPAFNLCKFTAEDYYLLSSYFSNIYEFIEGKLEAKHLFSIEVF